jgi:hypothetical protein
MPPTTLPNDLPGFWKVFVFSAAYDLTHYLLIAGVAWFLGYVLCRSWWANRKIIPEMPTWADMRREAMWSALSVVIYGLVGAATLALTNAGIIPLVALTLPIHPLAFGLFWFLQVTIAVAGHTGYEFHAKWLMDSWLGKFFSTPTNHIQHHDSFKGNFGLYFNLWDRWMGTNHPDYEKRYREVVGR